MSEKFINASLLSKFHDLNHVLYAFRGGSHQNQDRQGHDNRHWHQKRDYNQSNDQRNERNYDEPYNKRFRQDDRRNDGNNRGGRAHYAGMRR